MLDDYEALVWLVERSTVPVILHENAVEIHKPRREWHPLLVRFERRHREVCGQELDRYLHADSRSVTDDVHWCKRCKAGWCQTLGRHGTEKDHLTLVSSEEMAAAAKAEREANESRTDTPQGRSIHTGA